MIQNSTQRELGLSNLANFKFGNKSPCDEVEGNRFPFCILELYLPRATLTPKHRTVLRRDLPGTIYKPATE